MITADPNRIANQAMNMFIEMLEKGRDRVGVVAYAGTITVSRELSILCEEEINYLHNLITNLEYASWTDHPLGLLEAIHILNEGTTEGRQPIIIFLTDGNLNPSGVYRTIADAEYDKMQVISLAQIYEIPIHTIGLNYDSRLDHRYIDIVAAQTGGISFETTTAEELPDILREIFSLMVYMYALPEYPTKAESEPTQPALAEAEYTPIEILEEIQRRRPWMYVIISAILLAFMLFALIKRTKRVFTGRLEITLKPYPIQRYNLIEYGHYVTLQTLIKKEISPVLSKIIITPSLHAPSHLPQLLIKCKNPTVKFTKDFIEQDATKGLTINANTEISILVEDEQIHIKYLI